MSREFPTLFDICHAYKETSELIKRTPVLSFPIFQN